MKRLLLAFSLIATAAAHAAPVPTPEVFAPGVISGPPHESAPAFAPDGRTLWFSRSDGPQSTILEAHLGATGWGTPVTASFSGRWSDMEAALSPDGRYLVFASNRPKLDGGPVLDGFFMGKRHPGGGGNLWRVDRTASGWGAPRRLPDTINASDSTFAPSLAADGTLYFMRATADGRHFHLYSARPAGDGYEAPEPLPFSDDRQTDVDPAVAPDQSYLVFGSGRAPAQGMDLFIAFREQGRWGRPRHLGDVVNSPGSDAEPRLSPDGRTLYFSSERKAPGVTADWNNGKYNLWAVPLAPLLAAHAPAKAGEVAFTLPDPAAAPRGATELRVLAWYPAAADAVERPVTAGPVFDAGRVAQGAPWRDAAQRHPLVLLSHGFGGAARQMTWLGEALAREGYIAVAIDHPGTNGIDGINATGAYAPWERAADLRVLLDGVLAHATLGPRVDRDRIAVAGFSIGGWTASLVLGAQADFDRFRAFCASPQRDAICNRQVEFDLNYARQREELQRAGHESLLAGEGADYRDPRIKAGVLMAPALLQSLTPQSFARITVPTLFIAGDSDAIVPTPSNAAWMRPSVAGSRLIVMPGVGHYDFLSLCTPAGRNMEAALCREDGPPRAQTHERSTQAVLDFLAGALQAAAAPSR